MEKQLLAALKSYLKGRYVTVTLWLGAITAVLGFGPMAFSWLVGLRMLVWLFAALTLLAAIAAVQNNEDYQSKMAIFATGIILAVLGALVPYIAKKSYYTAVHEYCDSLGESIEDASLTESQQKDVVKKAHVEKHAQKISEALQKSIEKSNK